MTEIGKRLKRTLIAVPAIAIIVPGVGWLLGWDPFGRGTWGFVFLLCLLSVFSNFFERDDIDDLKTIRDLQNMTGRKHENGSGSKRKNKLPMDRSPH